MENNALPRFWDNPNYNIPDESDLNPSTCPKYRMKPEFVYQGPNEEPTKKSYVTEEE